VFLFFIFNFSIFSPSSFLFHLTSLFCSSLQFCVFFFFLHSVSCISSSSHLFSFFISSTEQGMAAMGWFEGSDDGADWWRHGLVLRRRGCGAHDEGGGISSWAVQVQTTAAVMICRLGVEVVL
jgi:hypothetical protein